MAPEVTNLDHSSCCQRHIAGWQVAAGYDNKVIRTLCACEHLCCCNWICCAWPCCSSWGCCQAVEELGLRIQAMPGKVLQHILPLSVQQQQAAPQSARLHVPPTDTGLLNQLCLNRFPHSTHGLWFWACLLCSVGALLGTARALQPACCFVATACFACWDQLICDVFVKLQ